MKKHKKIIVWGAKYDTGHTQAYTFGAFVKAAKYLNEEVYWLDDRDNVDATFFDNSLIITENQIGTRNPVSKNLPLRKSSTYMIHCLGNQNMSDRPEPSYYLNGVGRLIDFRFSLTGKGWSDQLWKYTYEPEKYTCISDKVSYLEKGLEYDNFYSMWATDLMPNEIDFEDRHTPWIEPKHIFFTGTIRDDNYDQFEPFIRACKERNVAFYYNNVWQNVLTIEQIKKASLEAFLAPDIRPISHVNSGYIPCRVFKTISYGQLATTNSKGIYQFFDHEIAFHEDPYHMFFVAFDKRNDPKTKDLILNQMKIVKEKHTHANRVRDIIAACEM
jgi:hypothetical protein